jgi:hypothetical protein
MLKHIFEILNIYFFRKKKNVQNIFRVLAVCSIQENIFFVKTQASQLIAIKNNKPCAYILKIYKKTEQLKKNQRWPLEANSPQIKFDPSTYTQNLITAPLKEKT